MLPIVPTVPAATFSPELANLTITALQSNHGATRSMPHCALRADIRSMVQRKEIRDD
jgi:hypothetical protein